MQYERFKYPGYETPLLEAYVGRFESIFVILHPFVRVPTELSWKSSQNYPGDDQIVARGSKCSWAEVYEQTGLNNCAKLNQALLASIGSLSDELTDPEAVRLLQHYLQSQSVWMPTEGRFEPLLQMDLLAAFQAAGCGKVLHVPELSIANEICEYTVGELRNRSTAFPSCGTLLPTDASFLFTVDWDSFFTLFYGPRDFVAHMARQQNLEGFFAYPKMEHFWFNYSMGCATVTISPEHWPPAC